MNSAASRTNFSFYARQLMADYRSRLSWPWFIERLSSLVTVVLLGILSYFIVSHFFFQSVTVSGRSMYPTLFDNGNYWLNRVVYWKHDPQRSDIVAVKDPEDGVLIVKRIIGMPSDSIYLYHGQVYVNGLLLNEPYLSEKMPTYAYEKSENEFFVVGKNEYFVMGDNRKNSCDSRTFGPIPRQNIIGKVVD